MCHSSEVDDSAYIQFNFTLLCFYMMGALGANFTMREVASSDNSCANCHYDIYQDTLSTGILQVIGNRFPWLYIFFSLRDSRGSSQNLAFSCDGAKRRSKGGRGCMLLKDEGILKRGNEKRKEGLIHISALRLVTRGEKFQISVLRKIW